MSRALAIAACASIFALAACALLAPGSAPLEKVGTTMGATIAVAAPMLKPRSGSLMLPLY